MVATQRIHARKIVTITADDHSFQLSIDCETVAVVPRTTSREIHRYKAAAHSGGSGTRGSQGRSS
jgi:hypothetical protein